MNKDDILAKSRAENAARYMDERERDLRLREDSAACCWVWCCLPSRSSGARTPLTFWPW